MDEKVPEPLDLAAVLAVEVDGVGVERERAEAEEQGRRGSEAEAVGRLFRVRWGGERSERV